MADQTIDVLVIGAGQSGLAVGYYLRRAGLTFVLLDDQAAPGGAWLQSWDSLQLFSPATASSLPGWLMPPPEEDGFPTRDTVITYLTQYEQRYALPVQRPVRILHVRRASAGFVVLTDQGTWQARAVVCATGSWRNPYLPDYPGRATFKGVQLHSAYYRNALPFAGKRVLVVGAATLGRKCWRKSRGWPIRFGLQKKNLGSCPMTWTVEFCSSKPPSATMPKVAQCQLRRQP
ncbi:NAD(P)-binding domain-containing protein [Hymenobacter volaticus]|uniref:NAD(P)-binding domain-containing protein n=1 Tax=Hymenobacter volaticus TaxID=2932254 RepID=UPI00288074E5|nr:NAD(P)-binding domain-containing protein [Hymenobacter volaticus]